MDTYAPVCRMILILGKENLNDMRVELMVKCTPCPNLVPIFMDQLVKGFCTCSDKYSATVHSLIFPIKSDGSDHQLRADTSSSHLD